MFDSDKLKAIGRLMARTARARAVEEDVTADEVIEIAPLLKKWAPGVYNVGEVVVYEGYPYKVYSAHDSTASTDWTPTGAASLFIPYHATNADLALPWAAPTGAHDVYKKGEFMIWTDGRVAECLENTNFSPTDYAQAWKFLGEEE